MNIAEAMPLLARHEGVWDGSYIYYNTAGEEVDRHSSRLFCRILPDAELVVVPETGHVLMLELPDVVNAAVMSFLATV